MATEGRRRSVMARWAETVLSAIEAKSARRSPSRVKGAESKFRFAMAFALLISGCLALAATTDEGAWSTVRDLQRLGPTLSASVMVLSFVAMWLSFLAWRGHADVLFARLTVAIPSLFWASQSVSSPLRLTEATDRQLPSAVRVALGLSGSCLIALDLVRERPILRSATKGLVAVGMAITATVAVLRWGLAGRLELQAGIRRTIATVVFPMAWTALGLVLLSAKKSRSDGVVRRCVGTSLLLLAASQVVAPPALGEADIRRAVLASAMGFLAMLVVLAGLARNLHVSVDAQRTRIQLTELDSARTAELLTAERFVSSLRAHDRRASLLAIEAVIHLLENTEGIDLVARHRLCVAATEELQRLRETQPAATKADLRGFLQPIVELANASGASVNLHVSPGLEIEADARLVDVVRNLISNAVRHGGNSRITIDSGRVTGDFVELLVTDAGPGVTTGIRRTLFDPGRTSGGPESSGLGLHSARLLLREMGGDLALDKNYVGGARFVATIPSAIRTPSANSA